MHQNTDFNELVAAHAPQIDRVVLERIGGRWELNLYSNGELATLPARAPAHDIDRLRRLLDVPRRFLINQEVRNAETQHRG